MNNSKDPGIPIATNKKGPAAAPGKFWWITLLRAMMAFGLGSSMLLANPPRPMFVNYMGV